MDNAHPTMGVMPTPYKCYRITAKAKVLQRVV